MKKEIEFKTYKIIFKLRKFVVYFIIRKKKLLLEKKKKEKRKLIFSEEKKLFSQVFHLFSFTTESKIRYDKSSCRSINEIN